MSRKVFDLYGGNRIGQLEGPVGGNGTISLVAIPPGTLPQPVSNSSNIDGPWFDHPILIRESRQDIYTRDFNRIYLLRDQMRHIIRQPFAASSADNFTNRSKDFVDILDYPGVSTDINVIPNYGP